MKLRKATPKDAKGIANVLVKSYNIHSMQEGIGVFKSETKKSFNYIVAEQDGKIIGIHCKRCKRIIVPPRMFCEYCFGPTEEWIEIPDTGIIETFSISYLDPDARRIEEPILVGVVDFDGTPPHHGFMHYFGEMTKDEISIGMRVKAVWKPENEREGSITDILYFRPLKGGET